MKRAIRQLAFAAIVACIGFSTVTLLATHTAKAQSTAGILDIIGP
ncbi:MAG TPA: hypothetical protein VI113_06065 [Alphaproteobacteria bacterium]